MKCTARKTRIEIKEMKKIEVPFKKKNRIKGESKKPKYKKIEF